MDKDSGFVGGVHEFFRHALGNTFFHVLENFHGARFETHAELAATGLFHDIQDFKLHVRARIGGPGDFEAAFDDFLTEFGGAGRMRRKGVVFEENFTEIGEAGFDERHFVHDILDAALAIGTAGHGLRNHAVGATERTAASRENDNEGVDIGPVEIPFVAREKMLVIHLADPGKGVQVFNLRTFGISNSLFPVSPGNAQNLFWMIGSISTKVADQFASSIIRFTGNDEVYGGLAFQNFQRLSGSMGSHHGNLANITVSSGSFLNCLADAHVIVDGRCRCIQNRACRLEGRYFFQRAFEVKVHRGRIDDENFIGIVLNTTRSIGHEHWPVKSAGFGNAGATRFARKHWEIWRVKK